MAPTEPTLHLEPLAVKERLGKERIKCWDVGGYDADDLFETGNEVKDVSQWLPEGNGSEDDLWTVSTYAAHMS